MKYIILITFYILLQGSSFEKIENCAQDFYLPVTVIPEKSNYKIGDTITISSKFSKFVTGYRYDGGKENRVDEFNMSTIKWYPYTDFYKIDTFRGKNLSPYSKISPYFDIKIDTIYKYAVFNYSNDASGLVGQYLYNNDSFSLQYRIIPILEGTYMICSKSLLFPGNNILGKQTYTGDCFSGSTSSFIAYMTVNENRDNNFDLLLESPDCLYNDYFHRSRQNFQEFGCYCIIVIK